MKYLLTVLFFCFLANVMSQISISAVINRRSENLGSYILNHFTTLKTANARYTHDYVGVKVDYQKRWFMLSGELSTLNKKEIYCHASYFTYEYGRHDYTAIANFRYLGFKLNPSYLFQGQGLVFKNAKAGLSAGLFFQTDFLVSHTENNHFYTLTSKYGTIYHDYNVFDAMDVKKIFLSYGIRLARRVTFKGVFMEINGTLGLASSYRTRLLKVQYPSDDNYGSFFFETGLSVGYTFPEKIGETETK